MRLIDADTLKNELSDKDYITYTHEYGDAIPVNWIMNAIDNALTVETFTLEDIEEQYRKGLEKGLSEWETERPKGHWCKTGQSFVNPSKFRNYCCSNCLCELDEHIRTEPNFCQNCGADMRGGTE